MAAPVRVWLHQNAEKLFALTGDEDGVDLPAHLGPWAALKPTELRGNEPDEAEALSLIGEHGYCCFE